MKTILFTLLTFLYIASFGQVLDINKSGTTTNVGGTLESSGYFLNEMPHCFFSKRDTAGFTLNLSRWGWVSFTGLVDKESHEINALTGDTLQYQGTLPAHNIILVKVGGTTSNSNDDLWIRVKNIRTGETYYGMALSGGANNYSQWVIDAYDVYAQPLDKYVIQARNKTNDNDLVIYDIEINIRTYHFE